MLPSCGAFLLALVACVAVSCVCPHTPEDEDLHRE